ncbi:GL17577 [Drosophila persimilis]|uniref:GL17577 n=1 Tax=Drosophila persimilis TaxID=7234 RepID=B4GHQ7_DROPE|nr:GL17577 [Drosophila persimilis]
MDSDMDTATVQASGTAQQQTATVKRNIEQQPLAKWPLPIAIWYPPTSSTSSATTFGDNGSLSSTATTSSNDRWVYQMHCPGLLLRHRQQGNAVPTTS